MMPKRTLLIAALAVAVLMRAGLGQEPGAAQEEAARGATTPRALIGDRARKLTEEQRHRLWEELRLVDALMLMPRVSIDVDEELARRALETARTLRASAAKDDRANDAFLGAIENFRLTMERGTNLQMTVAQNDLGVLLLEERQFPAAIAVFDRLDLNIVPKKQRFSYEFNYALALEQTGERREAWNHYVAVARARPDFDRAAISAFRVCLEVQWETSRESLETSALFVSRAQKRSALSYVHESISRWPHDPEMVDVVVRYYADAVSLADYHNRYAAELRALAERNPEVNDIVGLIELAYSGDLSSVLEAERVTESFEPFLPRIPVSWPLFAALLERIADDYNWDDTPENLRKALVRYLAAWRLDMRNTNAPLRAAGILTDHRELFDPNSVRVKELIREIFEVKGLDYGREDWLQIYRKHLLLASIYERLGIWGRPTQFDSALGQLELAMRAETKLVLFDDTRKPSPALRYRRAEAYRISSRDSSVHLRALKLYLEAAQGFAEQEAWAEAEKAVNGATLVQEEADVLELRTLERLRELIAENLRD